MERSKPQTSAFARIGSYLFLAIFCMFLILAAVAAKTHRVESLQQAYQQEFVATDASVSSHQYIRSSDGFFIRTNYRFVPPGSQKTFFGQDRFDRALYKTEAEAEVATENFSSTVKVYYHPQNPADSSQQPPPPYHEKSRTLLWAAGILVLCAGVTGLGRVAWDRYWRIRKLESFSLLNLLVSLMFNGLALIFAIVTVVIALPVASSYLEHFSKANWPSTIGVLRSATMEKTGHTQILEIQYSYAVDGVSFDSSVIDNNLHNKGFETKREAEIFLAQHTKEQSVKVFYNPRDPKNCYIVLAPNEKSFSSSLPTGLICLVLLSFGVFAFRSSFTAS